MPRRGLAKLLLGSAAAGVGVAMLARSGTARASDPGPGASLPPTAHELAVAIELGVANIVQDATYPEGHLFRYLAPDEVIRFQARSGAVYLTGPLRNWLKASEGRTGFLPAGEAWFNATLQYAGGTIVGTGSGSILNSIGCDGIHVTGNQTTLQNFHLRDWNDERTHDGIVCSGGTLANPRSKLLISSVNVRGYKVGIDWKYTVNSRLDDVDTLYCKKSVRLFGQSVNNMITGSRLLAFGDRADRDPDAVCISLETDYVANPNGISGEGLGISSTLLASARSAINCTDGKGFLSIGIDDSCVIDLLSGRAFDLRNVLSFKCSAQWVYSADTCFYFWDIPPAGFDTNAHIDVGTMICHGPFVSAVHWGTNNVGLQLGGNVTTTNANGGYPVVVVGTGAAVTAHIKKANPAVEGVLVLSTGNTINPSGDRSIHWQVSPVAQVPAAVTIALPRNGCNTFFLTGLGTVSWINADGWNGQEVTIIAEHRLTLRDGGNLKLAGDFSAAAGDTIKLACYGVTLETSNWHELSRSVNSGRRR